MLLVLGAIALLAVGALAVFWSTSLPSADDDLVQIRTALPGDGDVPAGLLTKTHRLEDSPLPCDPSSQLPAQRTGEAIAFLRPGAGGQAVLVVQASSYESKEDAAKAMAFLEHGSCRGGLLHVRLTSLSPGVVGREGCSRAQEVP